jgi:transmembrane sensor
VDQNQIINLIDKYLEGLASAEEEQLLIRFFNSFKAEEIMDEASLSALREKLEEKMLTRLMQAVHQDQGILPSAVPVIKLRSTSFWKYIAASVAVIAVAGSFYFNMMHTRRSGFSAKVQQQSFNPGSNKALLKLADGSVIELNEASNGVLAMQGSTAVKKTKDGQLIYEADRNKRGVKNTLNTISTPKGGQYQLTLPDGTKVWLNAGSSLTFPTIFDAVERSVSLRGEAYFEVAKVYTAASKGRSRMPFYVKTEESRVEVRGTHFNVMAYPDALTQETTLLEGSVIIKHGVQAQKIIPGQQATVLKHSSTAIRVKQANMESVMAWKEGLFLFDDSNIDEAMQQIGRWYNAEIVFLGPKPDTELTGVLPRSSKLDKVLDLLASAGGVQFRINGNQIVVQKK